MVVSRRELPLQDAEKRKFNWHYAAIKFRANYARKSKKKVRKFNILEAINMGWYYSLSNPKHLWRRYVLQLPTNISSLCH